jgi:DNA polymerase I
MKTSQKPTDSTPRTTTTSNGVVVFDLEADALLKDLTRIHCISLSIDGGAPQLYTNRRDREMPSSCEAWAGYLEDALGILSNAELLVGHNIIGYDLPALDKLYGFHWDTDRVYDTILASRIIYGDQLQNHSLEAWGYRLNVLKGTFKEQAEEPEKVWDVMTPEMGAYCNQDVRVSLKLYRKLLTRPIADTCWEMEKKVARIISEQERFGVYLDQERALGLYTELSKAYQTQADHVRQMFGDQVQPNGTMGGLRIPKRPNKTRGIIKGDPSDPKRLGWYTNIKVVEFNPNSRQQIARALEVKYGWQPKKFTPSGQPQVDEKILSALPYPEAKDLAWLLLLKKTMGQVHDGDNGWLKVVDPETSRIYGRVNTNGAVTGRMTHSKPNLAQIPSTHHKADGSVAWGAEGKFGADCRACFTATPGTGRVIVGCDASGLELRMLAHYMAFYDRGAYAREVLEGDIHSANQRAAGLATRDQAKTFIYGFLYGAGVAKIGQIVGKGPAAGKRLQQKFLANTPALKALREAVGTKARRDKCVKGLDGRILRIRHQHAALNTLLQGAGACVMKMALVILSETSDPERYDFILNVHDEFQAEVDEDYAEEFGRLAVEAIRDAGKRLNLRCPLDGEYKIGQSWQETH